MMKLFIMSIFFFFFLKKLNKYYLQMIYQIFIMFMFLMLFLSCSLNMLNIWGMLYYSYGVDYYSWGLISLSFWIFFLMMMSSNMIFNGSKYLYYMYIMNFMLIILILCFSSMNLISFYIYFESSLIMVFLLIMGWGLQVERIQAGFYMMMYTLFGSLPLFLMIIYLNVSELTLMMGVIFLSELNLLVYISMILAFLIKMPMYFMHLWLPKAHVEAPVMGSMILAGVMLKLGSYGLMRVMLLMMNNSIKFNKFFIIFSLMGGLFSSLICLCQVDMKMLVAYSSVVHMSILMSGLMTLFNWGFMGGYLMMIAHGLCSSGLFYLVNINYERLMSRSLYINKGMLSYMPSLSLMWFFLCSSNMSFPVSLNLFSEIMLINSLIIWSNMLIFILGLILFFSASYTLYLYSFSQHGKMNSMNYSFLNVKMMDFLLLLFHWVPLNLIFIFMILFI